MSEPTVEILTAEEADAQRREIEAEYEFFPYEVEFMASEKAAGTYCCRGHWEDDMAEAYRGQYDDHLHMRAAWDRYLFLRGL